MLKKLFYVGLIGLALFEILNVYFIMPMPGSQRMNSIDWAYFLYSWRWIFRAVFIIMILVGFTKAYQVKSRWLPLLAILCTLGVVYMFNFVMSADRMFLQPEKVSLKNRAENQVPESRLVIGVENNKEAKAYPISFLGYHHQVQDTVGGEPVIVTYCTVCRTGRVFRPIVNGKHEQFRLVGMDHFNAMFEDGSTGSWWRQATGEAITGELKGEFLAEMMSQQMTIEQWYKTHPNGLVMQPDSTFIDQYDSLAKYEQGKSEGQLTRTDSLSWKEKSWVIGVQLNNAQKAYDWNDLKEKHVINDTLANTAIALVLSADTASFAAFKRPHGQVFFFRNDTIIASDSVMYDLQGRHLFQQSVGLEKIKAYQEFWHSWNTFQPKTEQYLVPSN